MRLHPPRPRERDSTAVVHEAQQEENPPDLKPYSLVPGPQTLGSRKFLFYAPRSGSTSLVSAAPPQHGTTTTITTSQSRSAGKKSGSARKVMCARRLRDHSMTPQEAHLTLRGLTRRLTRQSARDTASTPAAFSTCLQGSPTLCIHLNPKP